ncbi:MAG: hypothetical protein AVDCRST_MAG06-2650, partial [uncultured Nocardioides sp.]
ALSPSNPLRPRPGGRAGPHRRSPDRRHRTRRLGTRPARQRRDPRRLHRLRLRPVRHAGPEEDGRLAAPLPLPGRRHLHLRGLPRLPRAAQPLARLGLHPARRRLAAAAHRARAAGVLPAAVPPIPGRLQDQPQLRPGRHLRRGATTGRHRGRQERRRRARARHRPRQHDLVRPRGLRPDQHRVPRVGAALHPRLDHPGDRARVRRRHVLQRLLGHQDARRRPRAAARPVQPPVPHLDRPLGRHPQHLDVLHPGGRLAPGRPHEAVPRRSRRDLGRRHDQHRQQLPRPRPRFGRRPRELVRWAQDDLPELPAPDEDEGEGEPRQGAPVLPHRPRDVRRQGQRPLQQGDAERGRAVADRSRREGVEEVHAPPLGVVPRRRLRAGAQGRLGRRRRAPAPAGPQRRGPWAAARHRRLRPPHRGRRPRLPAGQEPVGDGHDDTRGVGGPGRRPEV